MIVLNVELKKLELINEFRKRHVHGAFEATQREDCSKWLGILPAQWAVTRTEKAVKNRHNTCKCCRQLNTSDFENRCGASLKKVDKSTIYCMKKIVNRSFENYLVVHHFALDMHILIRFIFLG